MSIISKVSNVCFISVAKSIIKHFKVQSIEVNKAFDITVTELVEVFVEEDLVRYGAVVSVLPVQLESLAWIQQFGKVSPLLLKMEHKTILFNCAKINVNNDKFYTTLVTLHKSVFSLRQVMKY